MVAARRPISFLENLVVVKGGARWAELAVSSYPTTEISAEMEKAAGRVTCMAPTARTSLCQYTAIEDSGRAITLPAN